MYEKVSFRAAEDYSYERVFKAVESVFRDINAHELLGSAKKVVIKPNLVIRRPPEACATTHPAVLAAVLKLLEPYDAEVIVAETPGGVFNESVLMDEIKTRLFTLLMPTFQQTVICKAALGNRAGLLGALAIAKDALLKAKE